MDLIIKDTKADFNEYFDICNASDETKEKFETKDFLVVPSKYQDKEYYFAQETIDFIKYCRLNDAEHTYDVLADGDISVRSLHSFDIWMPVIWVAWCFVNGQGGWNSAIRWICNRGYSNEFFGRNLRSFHR